MSKTELIFNSAEPNTRYLSAFFAGPFIAPLGKKWVLFPTREAYYQAHKTKSKEARSKIINSPDPYKSKYWGSAKSGTEIIEGFDAKRKQIMREAIRYQMAQNPLLLKLLLATGDATLIEHAPWDDYFGRGRDGDGKNVHGKLLMEYRSEYKKHQKAYSMSDVDAEDLYYYPKAARQ